MTLLNKFEYNILKTIKQHPGLNPDGLAKYCDEPAKIIDCRMVSLITYTITTEGLQALADYESNQRGIFWFLFEDRFWKFAALSISCASLIISFLAYSKSQSTEQYVKIEISREAQPTIIGAQSQNVSLSKNSFEKNGMQQNK